MKDQLDIIAHVIQLAIAPVFLLTGIGALLGVMMQRVARIIDRARNVEDELRAADDRRAHALHDELHTLSRRLRLVNRAVTLCVLAALLVCAVIGGLFITAYFAWSPDLTRIVAAIFAAALLSLIAGLLFFLREVYIATATLRFNVK